MRARAVVGRAGRVFVNALYELVSHECFGVLRENLARAAYRKSRSNKALQLTARRLVVLRSPAAGCRPGNRLTRGRHPGETWIIHGRAAAERLVR